MKKLENKINNKGKILFISPLIGVWVILFCSTYFAPILNLIKGNKAFSVVAYDDRFLRGNSEASTKLIDNKMVFYYELKEGYSWPYAGVCFISPVGAMNTIQGEIFISIELQTKNGKMIPITLNEYIPGYSDTLKNTKFRPWTYSLKIEPEKTLYKIALSNFQVPAYWEKENALVNQKLPNLNSQKIINICIQNCTLIGLNKKDEIIISSMIFERDFSKWIWWATVFSGCWGVFGLIYFLVQQKKTSIFIPYLATETKANVKDEWEKIQSHISTHYMEELDMEGLEKELGIARHKIASLIKENTSLLFKQYLNQLRVAEAKRLLLNTDLPIGELADQVGFGHISNFNRVFKEYTGQSPSDLRKDLNTKF